MGIKLQVLWWGEMEMKGRGGHNKNWIRSVQMVKWELTFFFNNEILFYQAKFASFELKFKNFKRISNFFAISVYFAGFFIQLTPTMAPYIIPPKLYSIWITFLCRNFSESLTNKFLNAHHKSMKMVKKLFISFYCFSKNFHYFGNLLGNIY